MWQKLNLEKLNITIKHILEPNVIIAVETNAELDTTVIKVDNQMAIIQV